ncbi:MAG: hypothetical protein AAF928_07795 [Myxococcota bacterium]
MLMRIRPDQMRALSVQAARSRVERLQRALENEYGIDVNIAERAAQQAHQLAEPLEFERHEDIHQLGRLAALPGFPHLPGRWGRLLWPALANLLAPAPQRLKLVHDHLLPRIEAELEEGETHDESA